MWVFEDERKRIYAKTNSGDNGVFGWPDSAPRPNVVKQRFLGEDIKQLDRHQHEKPNAFAKEQNYLEKKNQ